ncbi:MAG: Gx transporter family protein [Bacilli bacterium]|nr:Gx transporter family protein [Bacilli bacterium]
MNKNKFNKLIVLSILVALASILSYFDTYICSLIPMGILRYKLGLANIVIMVILYNYDFKSAIFSVVVKSIIVGLFFGATGLITFILSLSGSMLSLIGMYCFKKLLPKSNFTPIIGLIGGFLHPVGQIIGAILIYGFKDFFASSMITAPIMLILGIITGIIVGYTTKLINKRLENKFN